MFLCVAEHTQPPLHRNRDCVLTLQVEELYEMYCIQWRLCQGAVNMKRAFSLSPSTRASRESLLELNRNHRYSQQVLSVSVCVSACVSYCCDQRIIWKDKQVWNSLPLWEVEWSSEATFSRASSHYEGPPHHTPTSPLFFQNHDLSESSLYQTGLDISWPVTLKLKFCSVRQFCLLLFSIE